MTLKALAILSKLKKKLNYYIIVIILKLAGKSKHRPRKKPFLTDLYKFKKRKYYRIEKTLSRDNSKICWNNEVIFEIKEDIYTF